MELPTLASGSSATTRSSSAEPELRETLSGVSSAPKPLLTIGRFKFDKDTLVNIAAILAAAAVIITLGALGYIGLAVRWTLLWVPQAGPVGIIGLILAQGFCQAFAVLGAGTIFAMVRSPWGHGKREGRAHFCARVSLRELRRECMLSGPLCSTAGGWFHVRRLPRRAGHTLRVDARGDSRVLHGAQVNSMR